MTSDTDMLRGETSENVYVLCGGLVDKTCMFSAQSLTVVYTYCSVFSNCSVVFKSLHLSPHPSLLSDCH